MWNGHARSCAWAVALCVGGPLVAQAESRPAEDPAAAFVAAVERAEAVEKERKPAATREAAVAAWRLCEVLSESALASDAVQGVMWRLGFVAYRTGDLRVAHDAWDRVVIHRASTLPDAHTDLQAARTNLAITKKVLGDLSGALALEEKALTVRSQTLPDTHPDLQTARTNLAITKKALGNLPGALALEEKVFAVRSRTLPDDHPNLQRVRLNLAATKAALGDLPGSLALKEKAFAVLSRTLPDDHLDLQTARLNLAITKNALGDLSGALALEEKAFAVYSQTLPDEHRNLQRARSNLALTKKALGDLSGALSLQERVFAVLSQTLPDAHPDLQTARLNLAATKFGLGDLSGALSLQERVFAELSQTLPDAHPDLQTVRLNLAATKYALGDLPGALALDREAVAGARGRLSTFLRSPREMAALGAAAQTPLSHAAMLLNSHRPALDPTSVAQLTRDALELLIAVGSAELDASVLRNLAHEADPDGFDKLALALTRATREIEQAIALPQEGRTGSDGVVVTRDEMISLAVAARDSAERAMLEEVPEELRVLRTAVDTEQLVAALSKGEVAVAFVSYTQWTTYSKQSWKTTAEERYGAFVLAPSGTVTWCSLGAVEPVRAVIAAVREGEEAGTRGRPIKGQARGRPAVDQDAPTLSVLLTSLRKQVLDPVLEALPDGTTTIVLSLAADLHLAPLDELPLAAGTHGHQRRHPGHGGRHHQAGHDPARCRPAGAGGPAGSDDPPGSRRATVRGGAGRRGGALGAGLGSYAGRAGTTRPR